MGVFVVLATAAWRGWDPVLRVQTLVGHFATDRENLVIAIAAGIVPWWETAYPSVSILTLPGLWIALALMRPPARVRWYALSALAAWALPIARFKFYVWISDTAGIGATLGGLVSFLLASIVWGALLSIPMRSRWPVVCVLAVTVLTYLTTRMLDGYRMANPGALMPEWTWVGYGFGWENLEHQILIGLGLILIALRSWRIKPEHLCPTCNYDRRGLNPTAPCPECGTGGKADSAKSDTEREERSCH